MVCQFDTGNTFGKSIANAFSRTGNKLIMHGRKTLWWISAPPSISPYRLKGRSSSITLLTTHVSRLPCILFTELMHSYAGVKTSRCFVVLPFDPSPHPPIGDILHP